MKTGKCALCGQLFRRAGQERYDSQCRDAIRWARRQYRIWKQPLHKPMAEDNSSEDRLLMEDLDRQSLIWLQQQGWAQ